MNEEYNGGFESSNQRERRIMKTAMGIVMVLTCVAAAFCLWLSDASGWLLLGIWFWFWGNNIYLNHFSK